MDSKNVECLSLIQRGLELNGHRIAFTNGNSNGFTNSHPAGFKIDILKEQKSSNFKIQWNDLAFGFKSVTGKSRVILSKFSGSASSGQLVAILGPSGVGKSTFLNGVAGQVGPLNGSITFLGKEKRASFAYVPQHDDLCPFLTVRESLIFSSKLKNHKTVKSHQKHLMLAEDFISKLLLNKCTNTYASRLSGGESKRLSIALELISNPHFLLLDEPTSGLDSSTAYKCMTTLKRCVTEGESLRRTAIILTIHQPSSKLFHAFDKVYILGGGSCIYEGHPKEMVNYFSKFNISCPTYHNPADFALELVCDAADSPVMDVLRTAYIEKRKEDDSSSLSLDGFRKITKLRRPKAFWLSYFLLVKKLTLCYCRDPYQVVSRLIEYLVFPAVTFFCIQVSYFKQSPCTFVTLNSTHLVTESSLEHVERRKAVAQCLLILFFNSLFVFLAANFPGILSVGSHVRVFFKEQRNNWYSTTAFGLAFLTVSCLLTGILSIINAVLVYCIFFDEQSWEQLMLYGLVNILTGCVGDGLAVFVSVLNPKNALTNIITAGVFIAVTLVLGGFIIRFTLMNNFAWLVSQISCFKYIFILLVKTLFYRDDCDVEENKIFDFQQVLSMLEYYQHKQNDSTKMVEKLPDSIMRVLREEETWNKTVIFSFAKDMYDFDERGMQGLQQYWDEQANYIYSEFDVSDYPAWVDFAVLSAIIAFFYLASHLVLLYRTRPRL